MTTSPFPAWHGTTILSLRKGNQVVVAGDGQVSMGQTVVKSNAVKVRRLGDGSVIVGFAVAARHGVWIVVPVFAALGLACDIFIHLRMSRFRQERRMEHRRRRR